MRGLHRKPRVDDRVELYYLTDKVIAIVISVNPYRCDAKLLDGTTGHFMWRDKRQMNPDAVILGPDGGSEDRSKGLHRKPCVGDQILCNTHNEILTVESVLINTMCAISAEGNRKYLYWRLDGKLNTKYTILNHKS